MNINIIRVGNTRHIRQQLSILQTRKGAFRASNHIGPVVIKRQFAYDGRSRELRRSLITESALFSEPRMIEPAGAASLIDFFNSIYGNEKGYTVIGIRPIGDIENDRVPIGIYPHPRIAVLYDAVIPVKIPGIGDLAALTQTRPYREKVDELSFLSEGNTRIPFITDHGETKLARSFAQNTYIREVTRSGSVPRHKFSDITGLPDLRSIPRGKMIKALPEYIDISFDTFPHEFLEVLKKATGRSLFIGMALDEKVSVTENGYASVTDPTATNSGIVDIALPVKLGEDYFWALLQSPELHEAIMLHDYSPDPAEFPTFAGRFNHTETSHLMRMGLKEYVKWILSGRRQFSSETNLAHIANFETVKF